MPELKLNRLEPSQEISKQQTKTKRSRSKQKDTSNDEKKSGPKTPRRSRSSSKSRSNSRKRTEVKGAKLYTKKDLEQTETVVSGIEEVKPARRNLRSSSSTSTKLLAKSEITDLRSLDDSLVKEKDSISEIELLKDVILESLDNQQQTPAPTRYSLRKRSSPASSDKQSKSNESIQDKSLDSSPKQAETQPVVPERQETRGRGCPLFTCGYLKYSSRQVINLIIVSLLMILALAVINYFNENSVDKIKSYLSQTGDNIYYFLKDSCYKFRSTIGLN